MAAVRCAARRLGGSLLQRAQAEEGRLLAPSRLMRLSSKVSGEQSQVTETERLLLEPGWLMRSRQLYSNKIPKKKELSASESEYLRALETLNRWEEHQKRTAPSAFKLRLMAYELAAKNVVRGAAKAMFCFCMISHLIFGDKWDKAYAVTIEDEMGK